MPRQPPSPPPWSPRALSAALACALGAAACGGGGDLPTAPDAPPAPDAGPEGNALLASLRLWSDGAELVDRLRPEFDPRTAAYELTAGAWLARVVLEPVPMDPAAEVTVAGQPVDAAGRSAPLALAPGLTTVEIGVRAPGGAERTYVVDLDRAAAPAPQAYVKATNTGVDDRFGNAVALSGAWLVVGAWQEDGGATGVGGDAASNAAADAGAAYAYVERDGGWSPEAYLKASNTGAGDRFGWAAAMWGDTLVVGAPFEDSAATGVDGDQASEAASNSGAVYVFVRTSDGWAQQAYLKASNTNAGDQFGHAVAIHEDTLVVGAVGEDSSAVGVGGDQASNGRDNSGAAYVFTRSGGAWTQRAYLKASNPDGDDHFGNAVAVWGSTIVVGAPDEDSLATGVNGAQADDMAGSAGAAYVFVEVDGQWAQQAYLKASNTGAGDVFGVSVAVWGDTVVVGAPYEDGEARSINGDQLTDTRLTSGAAYAFVRAAGVWTQQAYVKSSNSDGSDLFGYALALSGDALVVGALGEDGSGAGVDGDRNTNGRGNSGAAYVFLRAADAWTQRSYLKPTNPSGDDEFGESVAVWADTVAVAGWREDGAATGVGGDPLSEAASNSGAVYVFR